MKRRNFIAALLAIPFGGKVLEAMEQRQVRWVVTQWLTSGPYVFPIPEEPIPIITHVKSLHVPDGFSVKHLRELGENCGRRVAENTVHIRENTEALLRNAPTGFKKLPEKE